MKRQYIHPMLVIQQILPSYLMTTSNPQGFGLGSDITYGGEDEDGTIVPSVKSNSVQWEEWE